MTMRDPGVSLYRALVFAFAFTFAFCLVVVHFAEPEFNASPVSLYSLGAFGYLMKIGFVSLGLAFFSLIIGLLFESRNSNLYYADLAFFSISGIGLLLIGIFNTDAIGIATSTLGGMIHGSAAFAWSLACSVGILLFAPAFRRNGKSLRIGRWSRNLAIFLIATWFAGFFGQFSIILTVQPRLFYSLVLAWILLVGRQLRIGGMPIASAVS